jgi:hypothetical protein
VSTTKGTVSKVDFSLYMSSSLSLLVNKLPVVVKVIDR